MTEFEQIVTDLFSFVRLLKATPEGGYPPGFLESKILEGERRVTEIQLERGKA